MEILNNFGFKPEFFFAQVTNFLILVWLFKKFLYKPILKTLRDRQEKIAQGLEDAEKARLTLEEAKEKKDEIIKQATQEAEEIINRTQKNAKSLHEELMLNSRKEADKIISDAGQAVRIEFEKAKEAAGNMSVDLARSLLNRVLDEIFTSEEREKIIQRNIKRLT